MFSRAVVIADGRSDRRVEARHGVHPEPFFSIERVDRLGSLRAQKLPARVAPRVAVGAGDVEGARRDEGEQLVLVHGQLGFTIIVTPEVFREPVRELVVNDRHRFAVDSLAQRRSPATALHGHKHRESLVLRRCPQSGFTEPGKSMHRHAPSIELGVRRQVVHRATEPPRPRPHRAPRITGPLLSATRRKECGDILAQTIDPVGTEIVTPDRRRREAARQHGFDLPFFRVDSALLGLHRRARRGRSVTVRVVVNKWRRQTNTRIGVHGVVTKKI